MDIISSQNTEAGVRPHSVHSSIHGDSCKGPQVSDFKKFLEINSESVSQLMKVVANLYEDPKKVSLTPEHVLKMLNIEREEVDVDAIKAENRAIRHEIYELHDKVKALEDELEEVKEENM